MDPTEPIAPVTELPGGGLILTVRVIKSFEYRTAKNLVLHNVSPDMLVSELKALATETGCTLKTCSRELLALRSCPAGQWALAAALLTLGHVAAAADVAKEIKSSAAFRPYHNSTFDCLKLYFNAHGAKTQNLIINLDHDEYIMDDAKTLRDYGVQNETELSFFQRAAYDSYKAHPETKW
ncbi:hypothetical protein HK105_202872 [Polyrhizophydium stewartii]|uniref:Ubiquitin-like domain-containing protein n=1 Tax=Polyrhizophydium stewartii TaxID=2732419 RepID=A0ABR4NDK9_9FUNG